MNKPESLIAPSFLEIGDTVAIVAMASKLNRDSISAAVEKLEKWGLRVLVGESVGATDFTFSGSDNLRLRDFQEMLDNPDVKAVFSARGGYGSSRIIDDVSFTAFISSPKWIAGFSDITAVHGKVQSLGFQSIHGPMPKTMLWDAESDESLRKVLFGEKISYQFSVNKLNQAGEASGQLIGGNLALLAHNIGSPSDLDYSGKILFIEDVGEYLYNIDRLMVQLRRAGKLKNLTGLLVGQFSDVKENDEPFGKTAYEIIAEHTLNYNYPIAFDVPIGHTTENLAIRCGECVKLKITADAVRLNSAAEMI